MNWHETKGEGGRGGAGRGGAETNCCDAFGPEWLQGQETVAQGHPLCNSETCLIISCEWYKWDRTWDNLLTEMCHGRYFVDSKLLNFHQSLANSLV